MISSRSVNHASRPHNEPLASCSLLVVSRKPSCSCSSARRAVKLYSRSLQIKLLEFLIDLQLHAAPACCSLWSLHPSNGTSHGCKNQSQIHPKLIDIQYICSSSNEVVLLVRPAVWRIHLLIVGRPGPRLHGMRPFITLLHFQDQCSIS